MEDDPLLPCRRPTRLPAVVEAPRRGRRRLKGLRIRAADARDAAPPPILPVPTLGMRHRRCRDRDDPSDDPAGNRLARPRKHRPCRDHGPRGDLPDGHRLRRRGREETRRKAGPSLRCDELAARPPPDGAHGRARSRRPPAVRPRGRIRLPRSPSAPRHQLLRRPAPGRVLGGCPPRRHPRLPRGGTGPPVPGSASARAPRFVEDGPGTLAGRVPPRRRTAGGLRRARRPGVGRRRGPRRPRQRPDEGGREAGSRAVPRLPAREISRALLPPAGETRDNPPQPSDQTSRSTSSRTSHDLTSSIIRVWSG